MPRKKSRPDPRGPLQRLADRERAAAEAEQRAAAEPNAFTRSHGTYERVHGIDQGGAVHLRPHINRGGTPLARWRHAGLLSDRQNAAIDHCLAKWRVLGSSTGLVSNLDRTIFGCPGDGHPKEIEARADLNRIQGYFPRDYWSLFEGVIRFDEPAGYAGSRLTKVRDDQVATARTVVMLVADMIAWKERLSY